MAVAWARFPMELGHCAGKSRCEGHASSRKARSATAGPWAYGRGVYLILKGWLFDDRGAYGPGDFDEAGDETDHQPVVGPDGECICLAALDGDTRLHSRLGRWLRPFVGF